MHRIRTRETNANSGKADGPACRHGWRCRLRCPLRWRCPPRRTAQVSLRTVVDLAQRNSTPVRAAQADVNKSQAVLSESKDVFIPSLSFSTGIPAFPEVGFTGQPPSLSSATIQSLVFSIPQKCYIQAAQLRDSGRRDAAEGCQRAGGAGCLDGVHRAGHGEPGAGGGAGSRSSLRRSWWRSSSSEPRRRGLAAAILLQAQLAAANVKLAHVHLESRAATLDKQLSTLTGLPVGRSFRTTPASPRFPR